MSKQKPGSRKYEDGDSVRVELGSDAPKAGDAVAHSASGDGVVLTTGSNGFAGVMAAPTHDSSVTGDLAPLEVQGIVRAKVSAAVGSVAAGQKLDAGADGTLTNIDDGTASPEQAGPGDIQAWGEPNADGYALVRLP